MCLASYFEGGDYGQSKGPVRSDWTVEHGWPLYWRTSVLNVHEGLLVHAHAHHMCAWWPRKSEEGIWSPGTEPPLWATVGAWESNLLTFLVLRTNVSCGGDGRFVKNIVCVYREGHVNLRECWSLTLLLSAHRASLCAVEMAQRLSTYCLCRSARFGPSLYLDGGSQPFSTLVPQDLINVLWPQQHVHGTLLYMQAKHLVNM